MKFKVGDEISCTNKCNCGLTGIIIEDLDMLQDFKILVTKPGNAGKRFIGVIGQTEKIAQENATKITKLHRAISERN